MINLLKYILFSSLAILCGQAYVPSASTQPYDASLDLSLDNSQKVDSTQLRFPLPVEEPNGSTPPAKGMQGKDPIGSKTEVTFDPKNGEYILEKSIGGYRIGGESMTFEEYAQYDLKKSTRDYWKSRNAAKAGSSSGSLSDLIPAFKFNTDDIFDQLLGGDLIDIKLNGSAELIVGFIRNRRDDPKMDVRSQRTTAFNFDAKIEMNANARIGNKFDFKLNHNTEALFAFDNKLKLQYEGKEDEIIKLLQVGDVDFPLNTTLISGSQNLFGFKTKLQFGNTFVTGVFSEQRSESQNVTVQGGAQTNTFKFKADEYEDDRHFFMGHYFRDNYNHALAKLPIINSNINILKIEVWVTTIGSPVDDNRNIIAFTDLAESSPNQSGLFPSGNPLPSNNTNNLLATLDTNQLRNINTAGQYLTGKGMVTGRDFEKLESARKLQTNEYTFNRQLGFISLNTRLNADQVLAVAYQYQVVGSETIYQVGEFSDQGINDPKSLIVKLLKSSSLNTQSSLWKLMMKNVYSLNAYQVSPEDFRLNVLFAGDEQGIMTGYFKEGPVQGIPLIRLFGMDRLDFQQNVIPDGVFDFIDKAATEGGLIQASNGRIYLPYVEPFGKDLITIFGDSASAEKYIFRELYENTRIEAQQYPSKNKFYFEGSYKSSSSNEISIGAMNIPKGSVKVMAGNIPLVEDVDYTVDYMLGRVRIINEGILNSGVPINISSENNAMFNIMTKRMMGLRIDHVFNKNLSIGGTLMNLHQSPITQKVNIGEEPISNTVYGFDIAYDNESRVLTKLVDKILPFSSSKEVARLSLYGEFAHFIPGHARAIGNSGTTYIDDFESSKSTFNLKDNHSWYLASTPQWQRDLFPESFVQANSSLGLATGYNRAKLAWYIIDNSVFYEKAGRPRNISKEDLSDPYARPVNIREIFPNKELETGQVERQSILNLAFYPEERGPYNFDLPQGMAGFSAGLDQRGLLKQPHTRWGGIMRKIDNTDFEANNVEYIEFWVMDPFIGRDGVGGNPKHRGGKLFFNLGDVSEDVLRDGRKSFENGLPSTAEVVDVEETPWGRVPKNQSLVRAFDNDPNARQYQDLGYNGLNDEDERTFMSLYLDQILNVFGPTSVAFQNIYRDPAADNYHYFRGTDLDNITTGRKILDRYKEYNNPQGNSPSATQSPENYNTQQTNHPNTEDINGDNTLNEAENYFQYEVPLHPDQMNIGENYITDIQTANIKLENGNETQVRWYQFKIPVRNPDKVVGQIQNFQSIRFVRMFLKDFSQDVVLRFATLELVKSEWRKYSGELWEDNAFVNTNPSQETQFNVSTVNIEENGSRMPIPYVLPPGIDRQTNVGSTTLTKMNEQSLSLRVLHLADGDARGIYKTTDFDLRMFKHLRMMVHAEKAFEKEELASGELTLFVRMGADFDDNYYEYEIPLQFTPWLRGARGDVWPEGNDVDIDLEMLVSIKEERNEMLRKNNISPSYSTPFVRVVNGKKYTVVGTPTISAVKTIMIGVRNPKKIRVEDDDDGREKSAEIWINELRATDFSKKSGFAVTGRMQASLGDLGNVNVSGSHTSANFGGLETKITQLQQDNLTSYDISTNLELGQFVPPQAGVKVPFHYDYSRAFNNPEYSPLDPDVKTENDLSTYGNSEDRKAVQKKIQSNTVRQNINFMNVRKEYTNPDVKPHFYDIENFNVSYSYSSTKIRSVDVEFNNKYIHKGMLGYSYNIPNKPVQPFSKTALAKNKSLALLTDFNFNYLPKSFSFNTEINREFNETKLQNKSLADLLIETTYFKRFDWARIYDLKWDLASSLAFEYSANANSLINEPPGKLNSSSKKDSAWSSFFKGGDLRNFTQSSGLTWTVPIHKIPIFNWINATAAYHSNYRWEGATPASASLGNTIENSQSQELRVNIDFVRLYNKSSFLKSINQPKRKTPTRANTRPGAQAQAPVKEQNAWEVVYKGFFRILMGIRTAGFEYRVSNGTLLPGFMGKPTVLGTNFSSMMPGLAFAFGGQKDIRDQAAEMNLMSLDSLQNRQFMQKYNREINGSLLFEPFSDFRIQFTAGLSENENYSEFYKYDPLTRDFGHFSPQRNGSYSISIMAISTAFVKDDDNRRNATFEAFMDQRQTIAQRLANQNPHSQSGGMVYDTLSGQYFPFGYGPTSQDVLIPAFIAAYTGKDASKIGLGAFPRIPIPNWNFTYNGLTKLEFFKKHFNRISIQNGYRANYTVGSYGRNMNFLSDENGMPMGLDLNNNLMGDLLFENIVITEQFSPLVKVSVELKNNFQTSFEMKKSRSMSLSFTNNQLTENTSEDWSFGIGYIFKDVGFNVQSGNSRRQIKSDINLRATVSVRSNVIMLRRIDQNINTPSQGSTITSINLQADYKLTENFTIRLFYDQVMNNPAIPTLFYNSSINGGISLKLTINS